LEKREISSLGNGPGGGAILGRRRNSGPKKGKGRPMQVGKEKGTGRRFLNFLRSGVTTAKKGCVQTG